jgi:hypothetical protein
MDGVYLIAEGVKKKKKPLLYLNLHFTTKQFHSTFIKKISIAECPCYLPSPNEQISIAESPCSILTLTYTAAQNSSTCNERKHHKYTPSIAECPRYLKQISIAEGPCYLNFHFTTKQFHSTFILYVHTDNNLI